MPKQVEANRKCQKKHKILVKEQDKCTISSPYAEAVVSANQMAKATNRIHHKFVNHTCFIIQIETSTEMYIRHHY